MSGRWGQPGVPHKGWQCVDCYDSCVDGEELHMTCEMCETQAIRYVHAMRHKDYPDDLECGCICAEHMEADYEAPRERERVLRNTAQRRLKWFSRNWQVSWKGNSFLNAHGLNIVVFKKPDGDYGGRVKNRTSGKTVFVRRRCRTKNAAKLATFEIVEKMR